MVNDSNASFPVPGDVEEEGFPPLVRHIYIGYYIVIFLSACIGNIFAILTCYKTYKESTSVVLCYIASLAIADLLFTLLTPADLAVFITGSWVCGGAFCRIQSFLIESSYTASILTLAAISHERHLAVSSPLLARSQRVQQRKRIPLLIWIVAIGSCLPLLYAYEIVKDKDSEEQCVNKGWGDLGRQVYYTVQGILLFLVPLGYMSWAHYQIFKALNKHKISREKMTTVTTSTERVNQRKITKMLAVVTMIFVCCYLPFMLFRSLKYFYIYSQDMVWRFVQLMIFTQAAVNPIIYCFYSKKFRGVFKDLLKCRCNTIVERRRELSRRTRSRTTSSLFLSASLLKLHTLNTPELAHKLTRKRLRKTNFGKTLCKVTNSKTRDI